MSTATDATATSEVSEEKNVPATESSSSSSSESNAGHVPPVSPRVEMTTTGTKKIGPVAALPHPAGAEQHGVALESDDEDGEDDSGEDEEDDQVGELMQSPLMSAHHARGRPDESKANAPVIAVPVGGAKVVPVLVDPHLAPDLDAYSKAAYKRKFRSILARDTKEEREKQVHMTLFWGEGSTITGRNQTRAINLFRDPETNKAEAKAVKTGLPRLVDEQSVEEAKFGTWDGVWVSCMLNIFGVIMYLRLGWVVGNAGIIGAVAIILLSGCVTLLTTLSMSAIATNGQVKGGGAYYLISRSVGPAIGGSIGILFTVGLCIAVSLYVIGFCDSILEVMGTQGNVGGVMYSVIPGFSEMAGNSITGCYVNDIRLLGVILCTILIIMAVIGIGWVIKLQLFLIALIFATILSFLLGTFVTDEVTWNVDLAPTEEGVSVVARPVEGFLGWAFLDEDGNPLILKNLWPEYQVKSAADTKLKYDSAAAFGNSLASKFTSLGGALSCGAPLDSLNVSSPANETSTSDFGAYTFFEVFAIFFPACTGIMAGANISGLLVDPQKNIPAGTLHAVAWSTLGYIILAIFVGAVATRESLQENYFIMVGIELTPWLVWCGIFAATFSSALASIVGAPQLLMAVAKDDLMDCLSIFKTTHKRIGFKFVKAPLVSPDMNPNFSRKLRIYFVCEIFEQCREDATLVQHVIDGTLERDGQNMALDISDKQRHQKLVEAAMNNDIGINSGCKKPAPTLTELRLQIIDALLDRALRQCNMHASVVAFERSLMDKLLQKNNEQWQERLASQNGGKPKTRQCCCCVGCCLVEDPADPTGLGAVPLEDFAEILREVTSAKDFDLFDQDTGTGHTAAQNLSAQSTKLCEYISGFDYDENTPMEFGTVIKEGDPMFAYAVSYILACGCVCLGNLDIVAPLISMFFMLTYCLVNGAVFVQILSKAPGWRPSFTCYNGATALVGAVLCFVAMLLIDEFWAVIALIIAVVIFVVITASDPPTNWGSAPEAIQSMRIMQMLLRMRTLHSHTKTFRPHILAICGRKDKYSAANQELMRFAYTLRKGFGITMLGVVQSDMKSQYVQDMMKLHQSEEDTYFKMREPRVQFGKSRGIADYRRFALIENVVAPNILEGGRILLTTAGIGKMRPNTLLLSYPLGWQNDAAKEADMKLLFKLMEDAFRMRYHVMLFRGRINHDTCTFERVPDPKGSVDVWWITDDGAMSLLTPHLMMQSNHWKKNTSARNNIKLRHVTNLPMNQGSELEREGVKMESFLRKYRLNWKVEVEGLYDTARNSTLPGDACIRTFEDLHPDVTPLAEMSEEVRTWTHSWLRISEVMAEVTTLQTPNPKCIFVTLPFPRQILTPATYFGWLEMMSNLHDSNGAPIDIPVCFIRGNGRDVVTEEMD